MSGSTTPLPLGAPGSGIPLPSQPTGMVPAGAAGGPPTSGGAIQYGLVRAAPLKVVMAEEQAKAAEAMQEPAVQGVVGLVRQAFTQAWQAKIQSVQPRMLEALRARRGEYDPDRAAAIAEAGGSDVYGMLTSVKCRAAGSWIRDVMLGSGSEKPWTLRPTPVPDLPPDVAERVVQAVIEPLRQQFVAAQKNVVGMDGQPVKPPTDADALTMMSSARDQAIEELREQARVRVERMEKKMEDQLVEGGFLKAMAQFIDDITTFPAAILKGPVIRKRPKLVWQGDTVKVQQVLAMEFERVDPFNAYPSPGSSGFNDGFFIERHRLSRADLEALIGVEGYNDSVIRTVLHQYRNNGLREWLANDMAVYSAQGKVLAAMTNPDGLIDALQYWGSVPGQQLVDWGMDRKKVPDVTREYEVEAWVIHNWCIKITLNPDPLHRKPYYKACYEELPGSFWGNSVADLVRDSQTVVNASLRAIVNNMGMASGPQVVVNVERLPQGEDVTKIVPWKIWQVTNDPTGSGGAINQPVTFFQPESRIGELMAVAEKFSALADEYSGIPRYLTGDTTGGAGRTASGLSMLITNAGKSIKQVISNIDVGVLTPMLEKLYYHNMRYSEDPDLKGDCAIVARGATSLVAKESAQVRRNEFLMTTNNPVDLQIVGVEGRAAVLRETAKGLDMDTDKVVPPLDVLRQKLQAAAIVAAASQPAPGATPMPGPQGGSPAAPQAQTPQMGAPGGPSPSGQTLQDGTPQTDTFSPPKAA